MSELVVATIKNGMAPLDIGPEFASIFRSNLWRIYLWKIVT
jgi:hypothetical protein